MNIHQTDDDETLRVELIIARRQIIKNSFSGDN